MCVCFVGVDAYVCLCGMRAGHNSWDEGEGDEEEFPASPALRLNVQRPLPVRHHSPMLDLRTREFLKLILSFLASVWGGSCLRSGL